MNVPRATKHTFANAGEDELRVRFEFRPALAGTARLISILFPPDQSTAAQRWLTAIASQSGVNAQEFTVAPVTKAAQTIATHRLWLGRGEGTYGRLSAIKARTLVAYGADDVIVAPANAQILLRRIRHATSLHVGDAGHAFLFQDPTRVARAFTTFLRSAARPTAGQMTASSLTQSPVLRPLAASALQQPSGPPAWATIRSYDLIGTKDMVIPPRRAGLHGQSRARDHRQGPGRIAPHPDLAPWRRRPPDRTSSQYKPLNADVTLTI